MINIQKIKCLPHLKSFDFEPQFHQDFDNAPTLAVFERTPDIQHNALVKWLSVHLKKHPDLKQACLSDTQFLTWFCEQTQYRITLKKMIPSTISNPADEETHFLVMKLAIHDKTYFITFTKKPLPYTIYADFMLIHADDEHTADCYYLGDVEPKHITKHENRYHIRASDLNFGTGCFECFSNRLPCDDKLNSAYLHRFRQTPYNPNDGVIEIKHADDIRPVADYLVITPLHHLTLPDNWDVIDKLNHTPTFGFDSTALIYALDGAHAKPFSQSRQGNKKPIFMLISKHVLPYYQLTGQRHFLLKLLVQVRNAHYLQKLQLLYGMQKHISDFELQQFYAFRGILTHLCSYFGVCHFIAFYWLIKHYGIKKDADFFKCLQACYQHSPTISSMMTTTMLEPDFFCKNQNEFMLDVTKKIRHSYENDTPAYNTPLLIRFLKQANLNSFVKKTGVISNPSFAYNLMVHPEKVNINGIRKENLLFAKRGFNRHLRFLAIQTFYELKPFKALKTELKDIYGKTTFTDQEIDGHFQSYYDYFRFLSELNFDFRGNLKALKHPAKSLKNLHADSEYWHANYADIARMTHSFFEMSPEDKETLNSIRVPDLLEHFGVSLNLLPDTTVTQLRSKDDFLQESELMHHCVDSYFKRSLEGDCYVFHIESNREMSTFEIFYHADIELFAINQHQGKHNTDPSNTHQNIAKKVLNQLNRTIKTPNLEIRHQQNMLFFKLQKEHDEQYQKFLACSNNSDGSERALSVDEIRQLLVAFPKLRFLRLYLEEILLKNANN